MAEPRTLRTHPELRSMHSFPLFKALGEKPKSPLEKLLSVFADVRAGEGMLAVLMILDVFLLLGAYYLLKVFRDAQILAFQGAVSKSYSSSAQALVLLFAVPLYSWFGARVNRVKLVTGLTAFFMSHLLVFAFLARAGVRVDVVFYIWMGIFNLFVVSQFWAFANDVLTEGQGRRLFPIVGVGASLGAFLGSGSATQFFRSSIRAETAMFVALAVLAATIGITIAVHRRVKKEADLEGSKESEEPLTEEGAFSLIRRDRYIFWIAVLTIILNFVNTSGQYVVDFMVDAKLEELKLQGADRAQYTGIFIGDTQTWVNGITLLVQAVGVSRIFRYAGVRGAMFFMPVLDLIGYSVFAVAPFIRVGQAVKIMENATDYSLQNTVRQAFWLPTSREAKYKAKAAVDTFCSRFGDMASAGFVYVGQHLKLAAPSYSWILVGATVAWLWVAGQIATEHRRRTL